LVQFFADHGFEWVPQKSVSDVETQISERYDDQHQEETWIPGLSNFVLPLLYRVGPEHSQVHKENHDIDAEQE
jgi:hypothetical protein